MKLRFYRDKTGKRTVGKIIAVNFSHKNKNPIDYVNLINRVLEHLKHFTCVRLWRKRSKVIALKLVERNITVTALVHHKVRIFT